MFVIWLILNLCLTAASVLEALFWQDYWSMFVLGSLAVCSWIIMGKTYRQSDSSPYPQTVFPSQGSDSQSWF